jgi:hypothetical protein
MQPSVQHEVRDILGVPIRKGRCEKGRDLAFQRGVARGVAMASVLCWPVTSRPPGRTSRARSAIALGRSGKNMSTMSDQTVSKLSASNGRSPTAPTR